MRRGVLTVGLCLVACKSPARIAPEATASASASVGIEATAAFISEVEAIARVRNLPDVNELRQQEFSEAHPEGLGRKLKPVVISTRPLVRTNCAPDCSYTLDVFDEAEVPTDKPTLRFHLDAHSGSLEIELDFPYPKGRMSYVRYRKLLDEQRLIEARLFALPEVRALQKELERSPVVPPCGKAHLGLMLGSVPGPSCQRGPGCTFHYELRTPNGCVASLFAMFEVDSPQGDLRVTDAFAQALPYAEWSRYRRKR
jgi:hypothetical protein